MAYLRSILEYLITYWSIRWTSKRSWTSSIYFQIYWSSQRDSSYHRAYAMGLFGWNPGKVAWLGQQSQTLDFVGLRLDGAAGPAIK